MNHQDVVLEHLLQQVRQRFEELDAKVASTSAPAAAGSAFSNQELERRLSAALDAGRKMEQQRDHWQGQAEHWQAQATIAKKGQGAAHKQAEQLRAELAASRNDNATMHRELTIAQTTISARDFAIEGLEKQIADLGHRLDKGRQGYTPECEHTYSYSLGETVARCIRCGHTIPAAEFTQRHGCGPYTENAVLKEDC